MCKRAPALGFHYKLFQGRHVPDIVMTSGETSNVKATPQKANIIAVLKATCKELEARKQSLEELIYQLEQDTEVEDEGIAVDNDAAGDADNDDVQRAEDEEDSEDVSFHSVSSGEESS